MMTIRFSLVGLLACVAGCSFAARSPDMYRDDTAALLESRNAQIKTCYDQALQTNKDLQGRVSVKFLVENKTGQIKNVAADPAGTTAPEPLTRCVVDSLQGLVLDPGDQRDGDATFVYEFTPSGAVAAPAG